MSQNLPNMLDNTISKIREMLNANSVVGEPISTPDGVTIIPISKISVGLGGGGSDFVSKNVNHHENPFGGGVGAGVKVTPIGFLVIKDGSCRMINIAPPAHNSLDRIIEMVPDIIDKVESFIDKHDAKNQQV